MPEITPNPFFYVAPDEQSVARLGVLGGSVQDVYDMILKYIPDCRERAIVMTQMRAEAEKT